MSEHTKKNQHLRARRKLLKATAIGAGAVVAGKSLPEQWSRPVVDSVMLPAHAQTSAASVGGPIMISIASVEESILDHLVTTAHADNSMLTGELCFDLNEDGTVNVRALIEFRFDAPADLGPPAPCSIVDIAYLTGTVPQGTNTELTLQNPDCALPDTSAMVDVTMSGGNASGDFTFINNIIRDASTPFDISDPGCPIGGIPAECDQGDCVEPMEMMN